MECLIISAFVLLITLPAVVTGIEYNHNWSKLYNFAVGLINKVFKKNIALKSFGTTPNTLAHQVKTFKEWFYAGLGLFAFELIIKLILKFT